VPRSWVKVVVWNRLSVARSGGDSIWPALFSRYSRVILALFLRYFCVILRHPARLPGHLTGYSLSVIASRIPIPIKPAAPSCLQMVADGSRWEFLVSPRAKRSGQYRSNLSWSGTTYFCFSYLQSHLSMQVVKKFAPFFWEDRGRRW
jgi:hypothetical protein